MCARHPAGLTNRYRSIGSSNSRSVSALCQSPCKVLGHRDEDVLWSSLCAGTHVSHTCRGFSAVVPETLLGDLYYFHKNIDSVCPFYSQFSMCVQWNFPEAAWYAISQHIEMDMRIPVVSEVRLLSCVSTCKIRSFFSIFLKIDLCFTRMFCYVFIHFKFMHIIVSKISH